MTSSDTEKDREEILDLFTRLVKAHADKDADAVASLYAADAVIYDMAPPLGRRGIGRDRIAGWFDTWDGPVIIDARGVDLSIGGDLAYSTGLNRMRGEKQGEIHDLWFRATMCLERSDDGWRIVHDHTSVPFYMDGSDRAAVDLKPEA